FSQYDPRPETKIGASPQVGFANGLAICGPSIGAMMEVEVAATKVDSGQGKLTVTGIVDEEEIQSQGRLIRRKSMAKGSIENVMTVLKNEYSIDFSSYDVHVNFPSAGPVDGPSAGVTIAAALYSAIHQIPIDNRVALTGELSLRGLVKPVGGVLAKVLAAKQAGAEKVLIPRENEQEGFQSLGIEVLAVDTLQEVLAETLCFDSRTLVPEPAKINLI
ncbi:MAG: S16 family serine protease, partial [Sporomusaceae bacterium]|nr:S16 family serine protease [Sporomusaceae bacterium]